MRALREIRDGGGGGGARDAGNEDAVVVIVIRARDAGSEMRFARARAHKTLVRRGDGDAVGAATVSSGPLALRRVAAEHASLVARYTNARTVVRASNPTAAHAAPNTHACCGASSVSRVTPDGC